ncbi:MAG TPA: hypothetical protein DEF78_06460 [Sphingobacterium sp.]|uniref:Uncharacterized protein n=1 Tax=Sphingobacterium multivorum TaxID=28454 RepID=A0A653ZCT8_SPHMU|nr:conserved hypothetical protein [Sphingobacterium multivorum]HAK28829.1 hypothetical protein [Sphingobacterium sp.]HBW79967.1 hypothetical protein [Sphingobacterium sp.]
MRISDQILHQDVDFITVLTKLNARNPLQLNYFTLELIGIGQLIQLAWQKIRILQPNGTIQGICKTAY